MNIYVFGTLLIFLIQYVDFDGHALATNLDSSDFPREFILVPFFKYGYMQGGPMESFYPNF